MKVSLLMSLVIAMAQNSALALTLSEAQNKALSQSPVYLKAESQKNEAEARLTESYSGFLPTLNAAATYLADKKYVYTDIQLGGSPASIPGVVPTTIYTLGINWVLFDGFASTNKYLASRSLQRAANNDLNWTAFSATRTAALLYFKAAAAQEMLKVSELNLKALEDHLKDIQLFRKAGVSTNYDVLRVEVLTSEARSELMNAQDNVENTRDKLAEFLNQESLDQLQTALPNLDGLRVDLNAIRLDQKQKSDLISSSQRSEAADYYSAASYSHWIPRLNVFGNWQSYNNRNDRFYDADNIRDAFQVGASLSWNIFDGMASYGKQKQMFEQKYQAELQDRTNQLKAKKDFDFWKRKFKYFQNLYFSKKGDISKAAEAVRLAKEGHKVGSRTNTELLDAEADLFRARAGLLTAQIGFIEAAINLEMATGLKILDFN